VMGPTNLLRSMTEPAVEKTPAPAAAPAEAPKP
jgi:hypothetical protein